MTARAVVAVAIVTMLLGCTSDVTPARFDGAVEPCRFCRMTGSDGRTAAQLTAPGEEPLFFDDIGCLRDYLKTAQVLPKGAVAFVIDHRTGGWIRARDAVFTRADSLATPMGSHLIAHASAPSRDGDSAALGGVATTFAEVFAGTPIIGVQR